MAARRARALARVTHLEAQRLRCCKPYKATPREACATDVIEEGWWVVKIQWYAPLTGRPPAALHCPMSYKLQGTRVLLYLALLVLAGAQERCPPSMAWLQGSGALGAAMRRNRGTDKSTRHHYQHLYHDLLAPMAHQRCAAPHADRELRIFEVGLGCNAPELIPGSSVELWRTLFPPPHIRLELHTMEFVAECATRYMATHNHTGVHIHIGDQSSAADLDRVYEESGGKSFDVFIDDGSHINEHQIFTANHTLTSRPARIAMGGAYVIEDIHSSCMSWAANDGHQWRSPERAAVGGTAGCMHTTSGNPTVYSAISTWQKQLLMKKEPFSGVRRISIYQEAAVLHMDMEQPPARPSRFSEA